MPPFSVIHVEPIFTTVHSNLRISPTNYYFVSIEINLANFALKLITQK